MKEQQNKYYFCLKELKLFQLNFVHLCTFFDSLYCTEILYEYVKCVSFVLVLYVYTFFVCNACKKKNKKKVLPVASVYIIKRKHKHWQDYNDENITLLVTWLYSNRNYC